MVYSVNYIPKQTAGASAKSHDVALTPSELEHYDRIWAIANPNNENAISGTSAAAFLSKSGLSQQSLTEIWSIADSTNIGALDRRGFHVALKLIGHVQAGAPPLPGLLGQSGSMPWFEGVQLPAANQAPSLGPKATSPKIFGDEDKEKYSQLFLECGPVDGLLSGDKVRALLLLTGLPQMTLAAIWELADTKKRGALDLAEFFVAAYYSALKDVSYTSLPKTLPQVVLDDCRRAAREVGEGKGPSAFSYPSLASSLNPLLGLAYGANANGQQLLFAVLRAQQEEQAKFQKLVLDETFKQQQEQTRLLHEKLGALLPQYAQYMSGITAAPLSFPTTANTYSTQSANSSSNPYMKGNDAFNVGGASKFGASTSAGVSTMPTFAQPASASLGSNLPRPASPSADKPASYSPIPQYVYQQQQQPTLQPQSLYPFHSQPPAQQHQQPYYQYQQQQPVNHQYTSPPLYQQHQYQQQYPQPPPLHQQQHSQQHQSLYSLNSELDPIKLASVSVAPTSSIATARQPSPTPREPQDYNPSVLASPIPRAPQQVHPQDQGPRAPQYREPIAPEPARQHRAPQAL
ncbi:hypothetical protein BGX26_001157 [Mortierella sp. AD094]|nr:hypothetical protein BGX26_001157 [Mortierella sp. AD094]